MIKYLFRSAIRDRETIFYLFFFPVLLLTIFHFAFGGMEKDVVKVKMAAEPENQFAHFLKAVPIVEFQERTEAEAKELLKKTEINAFVKADGTLLLKFGGFYATIAKSILDTEKQLTNLDLPFQYYDFQKEYARNINEVSGTRSFNIIYLTYFAMMALQSAHVAMTLVNSYRANQTFLGQRIEVSPVKKSHLMLGTVAVSLAINLSALAFVLLYTEFILQKHLITHMFESLALLLVVNLLGIAMGSLVAVALKVTEGVKIGILTSVIMLFSLLGGMMSIQLKQAVLNIMPWMAYVNPVNLFTDAITRINLSGDTSLFLPALGALAVEIVTILAVVIFIARRGKYDSI